MSDDQSGDQRPDYSADLSGTPEDTPDSPPTRPAADPGAGADEPEVRRVRADDRRDDPAATTAARAPRPLDRRRPALVGAGLLGVAALVGAFWLGRATADEGPQEFDPASVGAGPGGPFDDHGFGDHGFGDDDHGGWGDRGPGEGRDHRWPGPGADRPGPGGWDDHFGPGDRPDRDQDNDDNADDDADADDQGDEDTGDGTDTSDTTDAGQ